MMEPDSLRVLLAVAMEIAGFLLNWFIQSTVLLSAGLSIGWLVRRHGSALQSTVYRTTLATVLVAPLATGLLSACGVHGWAVDMPAGWVATPSQVTEVIKATPSHPTTELQQGQIHPNVPQSPMPEHREIVSVPVTEWSTQNVATPPHDASIHSASPFPEVLLPPDSPIPSLLIIENFGVVALGVSGLWSMLSLGLLLRLLNAHRRVLRLRRQAVVAETTAQNMCCELAVTVGVVTPEVLRSPWITSPFLVGIRRPAVLLPDAELDLPLREVLIHELAHVLRGDCLWNLIRQGMLAFHWFQPLLWILSRRLDAAAEDVCDDYVVHFGGDRTDYAQRLVDLAELAVLPMQATGVGMISIRSMLGRRVARILDRSRALSTRTGNRLLAVVLLSGMSCTIAIGFIGLAAQPQAQANPVVSQKAESSRPEEPASPTDAKLEETINPHEYAGQVVDVDGKPVAGAKLHLVYHISEPTTPLVPSWKSVAITDADGKFQFSMRDTDYGPGARSREWESAAICAVADGYGFAWSTAAMFERDGAMLQKMRAALTTAPSDYQEILKQTLSQIGQPLRMTKDDQPLRGAIIDINGAPVAGAKLTTLHVDTGFDETLDEWLAATKRERADFYSVRAKLQKSINGPQVRSLVTPAVTDQQGRFVLRGVGRNRLVELLVEGPGIQSDKIVARTQPGDVVELFNQWTSPDNGKYTVHPMELVHIAGPSRPIAGVVRDIQSGKPIAGATVLSQKRHGRTISGWGEDFMRTVTDAEGRYRLTGMPIGADNQIAAMPPQDRAYLPVSKAAKTSIDVPETEVEISLPPGVWVTGRVTDKPTGKGLSGIVAYFAFNDNPHLKAAGRLGYVDERELHQVAEDGQFRIAALPGRGIVAFQAHDHQKYPRGAGADQIAGAQSSGGGMKYFLTHVGCMATNHHYLAEVNPDPAGTEVTLNMQLDPGVTVIGRVVDDNGKSVPTAWYSGQLKEFNTWNRVQSEGQFSVNGYDPGSPRQLVFFDRERHLAGQLLLSGPAPQPLEVRLQTAGTVKGRLIDESGDPVPGMRLLEWSPTLRSPIEMAPKETPQFFPLPPNNDNLAEYATDERGHFEIAGLVPDVEYRLRAISLKTTNGAVRSGTIDAVVRVESGKVLDLGDVRFGNKAKAKNANDKEELSNRDLQRLPAPILTEPAALPSGAKIAGRITKAEGLPAIGAHVAAYALRLKPWRGGDLGRHGEVLASGITDQNGHYTLLLQKASSKSHMNGSIIARQDGAALVWRPLDLDAQQVEASFVLPAEEPIRGRLVDIEGQPAAQIRLSTMSIVPNRGKKQSLINLGFDIGHDAPAAWIAPVISDREGRFVIHGVSASDSVSLSMDGNERFAPQHISLGAGLKEQRGPNDRTYRSLVKNVAPGDEAVVPLAPAQPFEGVVRFADTGEPAPHARLTIWASQQEFGSMISVAGAADDQGRYRMRPYPGIRFGVTAYPPDGTPYLAWHTSLDKSIPWEAGDTLKRVDIKLPRGVRVKGRIVESGTQKPVAGAEVQYHPESAHNRNVSDEIVTGWQDMRLTDADGRFQIVVLPGPGRLLAHGAQGEFILHEISGRELSLGTPGGQRNYAHAIYKIEPKSDDGELNVTLELQRGGTVSGRIVDEQQQSVEPVLMISRLAIHPSNLTWRGHPREIRGGAFQQGGLDPDREYPVYFLDPKRQLGAAVTIREPSDPLTVVLKPCGQATVRFVDEQGQPVVGARPSLHLIVTPGVSRYDLDAMKFGLAADEDFVGNIDRMNYWDGPKADDEGRVTLPALIPGANYQLVYTGANGRPTTKSFTVESQQTLELGEIVIQERQ